MLIVAILMEDWWGLVNVISMIISIVVRQVVVGQNHAAIDRAVKRAAKTSAKEVKGFVTLPTGELITIKTSKGIVLDCLLTNPRPPNPKIYLCARAIGWLGFGGHVISLGMAALLNQLLAVAVLVGATVLVAWQVGDDEFQIGQRLCIKRSDHPLPDWRAPAMARLNLLPSEEDFLSAWNLFPQRSNKVWWQTFRDCKENPESFLNWAELLKAADRAADVTGKSVDLANGREGTPYHLCASWAKSGQRSPAYLPCLP